MTTNPVLVLLMAAIILKEPVGWIKYIGIVYVKMLGACVGCPLIDVTLKDGIEQMLLENVPGIIAVVTV